MEEFRVIGKSIPRIGTTDKAKGTAKYALDLQMVGMLHGKILRSVYAHAKIINVDTSKAEKVKGVEAVICGRDVSKTLYGDWLSDQTVLAMDKVRYIGEPVAAVAAIDEDIAEEALNLIEVEYEELEPIIDPEKSMEMTTNLIHDKTGEYEHLHVAHPKAGTNICNHFKLRKGDVEQGFTEAYRVYENKFTNQMVHHCYMEPLVVIADIDLSGNIILYGSFQSPFISRDQLAKALQIPKSKIRVIVPNVGGGFGGKSKIRLEPIAVSLSLKARKPVKIVMSREEVFIGTVVRHPTINYLKIGVAKDGRILAVKEKIVWDTGAYADDGPSVSTNGGCCAAGPYQIPNVWMDSYCVYTNKPISGAFRGFGVPQVTWSMESQMDIIAKDLGIDPLEMRLKNAAEEGSVSATGEILHSVGIKETIRQAGSAIGWGKEQPPNRGIGIACMHKFTGPWYPTSVFIKIHEDGNVEIFKGATELGQGVNTILSQITAEVLGISMDQISLATPDTAFTPYDWATVSSRSTFFSGNAAKLAAEDARRQLINVAAEMLKVNPDTLVCKDGRVFVANEPETGATLAAIANHSHYSKSGVIIGKGSFVVDAKYFDPETGQNPRPSAYWMYATQGAEVEVDRETGEVKLLKLVAAHDAGRALNPTACEEQIEGSLVTGIGTTLFEELALDSGKALNASFVDYKLPRAEDVPELVPIIVENPHEEGPFGAKGIGEPGLAPTAAAISNAIYNAVGVRIKDLPITPEKILAALQKKTIKEE